MASSGVKLVDLKVADLKRDLEERDIDHSGTKSVLVSRLKQAMLEAGDDPETFLFETEASSLKSMITRTAEKLQDDLTKKLNSNCKTLKEELATEFNYKICNVEDEFKKTIR